MVEDSRRSGSGGSAMDRDKMKRLVLGLCLTAMIISPAMAQSRTDPGGGNQEAAHLRDVPFPGIREFQGSPSFGERSLDGLMRRWWLYRGETRTHRRAPLISVFGEKKKIEIPWHWKGFSVSSTFSRHKTEHWDGLLEVVYEDERVQIKEEYNPEKIIVVNGKVVFNGMERLMFTIKKKSKIEK